MQRLAEAVEQAMRPAIQDAARDVALAALEGVELPTTDPGVLVEAIFQTGEMAQAYWSELVADAGWIADGHDSSRVDGARYLVRRMAEVADVLLDHLSTEIEA